MPGVQVAAGQGQKQEEELHSQQSFSSQVIYKSPALHMEHTQTHENELKIVIPQIQNEKINIRMYY